MSGFVVRGPKGAGARLAGLWVSTEGFCPVARRAGRSGGGAGLGAGAIGGPGTAAAGAARRAGSLGGGGCGALGAGPDAAADGAGCDDSVGGGGPPVGAVALSPVAPLASTSTSASSQVAPTSYNLVTGRPPSKLGRV
jgi:hypothetical protein